MLPRLPRSIAARSRRCSRGRRREVPFSTGSLYHGGITAAAKPASRSSRRSGSGENITRWLGVKPPQASSSRLSLSEPALTVSSSRTPSGASSERSIRTSSSGRGRCARTDHIVITSNPPAAISGISAGDPWCTFAPLGLRRAASTASSARSTPKHAKPRSWAMSRNSPLPQPKSSSRRPAPSANSCPERRHRRLVAADPLARVLAGEELRVAPGAVEVAEPLGPDAGMPVEQAAGRAADHVVVPARHLAPVVVGVQQRLHAPVTAQHAADGDLDLRAPARGIGDPRRVLLRRQLGRPADPRRPAELEQPVGARERQVPRRAGRQDAAGEPHGAAPDGALGWQRELHERIVTHAASA